MSLTKDDYRQIEHIVEQTVERVVERVVDDKTRHSATKDDLVHFATKDDLQRFATKEDLQRFATKEDLQRFATKDDLLRFATKDDLQSEVYRLEVLIEDTNSKVATMLGMLSDHLKIYGITDSHEIRLKSLEAAQPIVQSTLALHSRLLQDKS